MYLETVDRLAEASAAKAAYLRKTPARYLAAAILAGVYVSFVRKKSLDRSGPGGVSV